MTHNIERFNIMPEGDKHNGWTIWTNEKLAIEDAKELKALLRRPINCTEEDFQNDIAFNPDYEVVADFRGQS